MHLVDLAAAMLLMSRCAKTQMDLAGNSAARKSGDNRFLLQLATAAVFDASKTFRPVLVYERAGDPVVPQATGVLLKKQI